jgi:hypothetical protein
LSYRATAARLVVAGLAIAAITVTVPGHAAGAAGASLHATPGAAIPGASVTVSGTIPSEAGQPYSIGQLYTNGNVARVEQNDPGGGVAGPNGEVTATVTIPADAARSNILRPYGSFQYDEVLFSFPPGCPPQACVTYGANVNVLPISNDEHITLETLSPRTGDTNYSVTVTDCVGGIAAEFTRVVDNNGSYFPFTGSSSGTTFHGTADLSHGFRGKYGPQGAARVSNPIGIRDAYAAIPCTQSIGPDSVAEADHLEHSTNVVDITICPASGACAVSNAVAPAGQPPVFGPIPGDSTATVSLPAAGVASAVTAEPDFVG